MCQREKADCSIYVETVFKDGLDLLCIGKIVDLYFLAGKHIPKFCDVAAKVLGQYPIYEKYATAHLRFLDSALAECLERLYAASCLSTLLVEWKALCQYVQKLLGSVDIREYQSASFIKEEKTL